MLTSEFHVPFMYTKYYSFDFSNHLKMLKTILSSWTEQKLGGSQIWPVAHGLPVLGNHHLRGAFPDHLMKMTPQLTLLTPYCPSFSICYLFTIVSTGV